MADRMIVLDRSLRLLAELVDADHQAISEALERSRVLIRAGSALTSHPAETQAALATLLNVLVRSGLPVELDLPTVPVATPLLPAGPLIVALMQLGDHVLPGSVVEVTGAPCDLVLVVGPEVTREACRVMYLGADGDCAWFDATPAGWSPSNPLVALAAAGLAGGEAVRHAVRAYPPQSAWAVAALRPVARAECLIPAMRRGSIDLGRLDIISAGAVTDAVIWTLRAQGEVSGTARVFDDGAYDMTNLNRYMELDRTAAAAGMSKAVRIARTSPSGLVVEPVERRFSEQDIADAAPMIIVGADDIAVRHTAQQAMPDWLGIGATSHNEARITEHWPDGPCAGCAHPHLAALPDEPIPTIAPVSFWAGFMLAVRMLRAATGGGHDGADAYATYYPLVNPGRAEVGPCPFHPKCRLSARHREAAS